MPPSCATMFCTAKSRESKTKFDHWQPRNSANKKYSINITTGQTFLKVYHDVPTIDATRIIYSSYIKLRPMEAEKNVD